MTRIRMSMLLSLMFALASCAMAVDYPVRPIQNIIPFSAGGGTDVWNRRVMEEMSKVLGQTIVSSNMTGGSSGSIGVDYVWKARHDGYTLSGSSNSTLAIPVMTGSKVTSKDWRYFVVSGSPGVVLVNKAAKFTKMDDILKALRDNPDCMSIGGTSGGLWFANAQVMLNHGGYEMQWIPYDGSAAAIKGAVSGEIDMLIASAGEVKDFVRSGDLIPLAVLDTAPWSNPYFGNMDPITKWMPETAAYYPIRQWLGFMAAGDTDPAILKILEDAFAKAMATESVKSFAEEEICVLFNLSGDEAQKFVKGEESLMCWILYDIGQTRFSPEEFGIERP